MTSAGMLMPLLATMVAVCGAALALRVDGSGHARPMIPFSAGLLVGVAVFGLFPETGGAIGWLPSAALFVCGYVALFSIDRFVTPVCPSCSRGHDHSHCDMELHGFAMPMIAATSFHAMLDGWGVTAGEGVGLALPLAVILHKIPEGIALGAILRAAIPSRWRAFAWCAAVESATLAGGAIGLRASTTASWTQYALAAAAGCFFYLGFHAVHEEWRRRGNWAFVPALTGAAGAAALQQGFRVFPR
jgi:zinc transporter ZupT